jgi:type II secretory pathway pseudopilin PulG
MVNLIITLISIALIAIVAVAALYNGGDAFRQGSANASGAQLVNAAQQISAANILYANDNGGRYADDMSDLTTGGAYLSSTPRVPAGFIVEDLIADNEITITSSGGNAEICQAVNKQGGYGDNEILADANAVTSTFGCFEDGDAHVFLWK